MENNALQVDYSNWEAGKQYPEWMDEISLATISKGYLLPGEDVKKAYRRVSNASATRLKKPELANKFFKIMWNGWLGLASPVLSNLGTFQTNPSNVNGKNVIKNPDEYEGNVLAILTESPTYSLYNWASKLYKIKGNGNTKVMVGSGVHSENVWMSIIFQIMFTLLILEHSFMYLQMDI